VLTLSWFGPKRRRRGLVRIAPEGRVLDFAEKIPSGTGLVNAGVYVAQASLFAERPRIGRSPSNATSFPKRSERGDGDGRGVSGAFVDIGLPEWYLQVRDHLPRGSGSREDLPRPRSSGSPSAAGAPTFLPIPGEGGRCSTTVDKFAYASLRPRKTTACASSPWTTTSWQLPPFEARVRRRARSGEGGGRHFQMPTGAICSSTPTLLRDPTQGSSTMCVALVG
jgi:hypothetical protein